MRRMLSELPMQRGKNWNGLGNWIAEHRSARLCLIVLLLFALFSLTACGKPLVRTETVEVRVPVRPNIPAELLRDCTVERTLPTEPTVGDLVALTEDALVELRRCSAEKQAIREAIQSLPESP